MSEGVDPAVEAAACLGVWLFTRPVSPLEWLGLVPIAFAIAWFAMLMLGVLWEMASDFLTWASRIKTGSGLFRRLAPRLEPGFLTIEHMTIQRMEHVGIVVDDLPAAIEFFVELGLELKGEGSVEGPWVDRVVGLDGVRVEVAMLQTPDGHARLELSKFHTPSTQGGNRHAPANTPGIRHIAFAVEDIDAVVAGLRARGAELVGELERYEDSYRLCYVRGPEGIIVELAEQIG